VSFTQTFTRTLRSQVCIHAGCGVIFGIETNYDDILRREHKTFYCTNGHSQYYSGKSDLEIARAEAERAKADAQFWRDRKDQLARDLQSEKHKVAAERGAKTKLRKRIANGVCPCCKRTFANVARHVAHMHPEELKR
jgi:hypothetical protein